MNKKELASYIDHTILKPEATEKDVLNICKEAKEYHFASVCVNPVYVKLCARELENTPVKVCAVSGFPLGANSTEMKAFEAKNAVSDGATEIDMVIPVGKLFDGDYDYVENDIRAVVEAAGKSAIVKVIIEACLLSEEQKRKACEISKAAGAHFVKTSTGFNKSGATVEDIRLMRSVVGEKIGVKAAGGIRDYKTAMEMIDAGASRIGASASVKIIEECQD